VSALPLPLRGVRVVDASQFVAGPYAAKCLAALGADVIKVERPPAGELGRIMPYSVRGQSGYYLQQNMGKKGLCVDLKDPRGRDLVRRLAARSDVLVENFRPGVLDRLGLGYADLVALNPSLVYCSISAYGRLGPDAGKPGFGILAEAQSGVMSLVGLPGDKPPVLRLAVADGLTGAHAVAAVCATLYGRQATGRGRHIDLALFDCMVALHDFGIQHYTLSGGRDIATRSGYDVREATPYGVFEARDGYLVICAHMAGTWRAMARLMGGETLAADPRFHDSPGRNAHREEILERIEAWTMAQESVAACLKRLEEAGVPAAPVQTVDQVVADPQVRARGLLVEQEHPALGKTELPGVPLRFAEGPLALGRAPLLGEHNREIARDLGYADPDIAALERDGVLHSDPASTTER